MRFLTLAFTAFLALFFNEETALAQAGDSCAAWDPCPDGYSCIPFRQVCHRDSGALAGEACQLGYGCARGYNCEAGSQVCRAPGKFGDACHLTRPCGDGLYCQSFVHKCAAETVSYSSNSPCGHLRIQATAEDAKRLGSAMSFGAGSVASAGASLSYETGLVYGEAGQFGCYATACMGYESNVSIANFASFGIAESYEAFRGFSVITGGGADTPIAQVGFQTSQMWRTDAPTAVVRRPGDVIRQRPIGTASGFTFGVGLSPVSVGTALCFTAILDEDDPLANFSDIERILTDWADAGFAPGLQPYGLPGFTPVVLPNTPSTQPTQPTQTVRPTEPTQPTQPLAQGGYPTLSPKSGPPPRNLRSKRGDTPTEVVFNNRSDHAVEVFWVDYEGREVSYGRLEPGEKRTQQTYVSHPWIVRGPPSDEPVGWVIAARKRRVLRIKPHDSPVVPTVAPQRAQEPYPTLAPKKGPPPPDLRSKRGDQTTEVVFNNRSAYPVDVFWVDYEGREVSYGRLEPGEIRAQQTYASHPWIVRGPPYGDAVAWIIARKKSRTLVIRPN